MLVVNFFSGIFLKNVNPQTRILPSSKDHRSYFMVTLSLLKGK